MKISKIFLFSIFLLFACLFSKNSFANSELWFRSGSDNSSSKYSSLDQINISNVKNLINVWTYRSGFPGIYDTVQTNPIFTGENLITTALDGRLIALNPESGKLVWQKYLPGSVGRRGITYSAGKLFVPTGAGVYLLDSKTGNYLGIFGSEASLLPPIVTKKLLLTANFVSGISAYSLDTNEKIWNFGTEKDGVVARLWSGFSYDEKLNLAFVVTSDTGKLNSKPNQKGGYANSLLAIHADSGKLAWQFQEIESDLWDLDMVGPPMVVTLTIDGVQRDCVVAVSKSGNTLILDRLSGRLLGKSLWKTVNGRRYLDIKSPKPFSSTVFRPEDITDLSDYKKNYVLHKIGNADATQYKEVNLNKPIVFFGLHGGAEWPGAAVDTKNGVMVVPSNRYPWILRKTMKNASSINPEKFILKNETYQTKCLLCHQASLAGDYQGEFHGDSYIPSLIGLTLKMSESDFTSTGNFRSTHKYAWHQLKLLTDGKEKEANYRRALKVLQIIPSYINSPSTAGVIKYFIDGLNVLFTSRPKFSVYELDGISENDLLSVYAELNKIDVLISSNGGFGTHSFWQLLLDPDSLPGSNPPWGLLTAINLNTGETKWQIPFGYEVDTISKRKLPGGRNFGGVIITKSGIIFANGTTDEYARAYNIRNGNELWNTKIPFAGSSPPMTYLYKGCQYLIFTATGGRFVGFGDSGDATVAYKLNSCRN